jgi:endonuclease/exonuclease/phosphatase family metal-dependent hydrolase
MALRAAVCAGALGSLPRPTVRIATWNLNNRVGRVRFRPEAADAAIALEADVLVFTEFFPQQYEDRFRTTLANAGWKEQLMSAQPSEVANRVLVASKLPLAPLTLDLPTFDQQFPANLLGVRLPLLGLSVLSVRVPAYAGQTARLLFHAWEWLEATMASLKTSPSVVIGDLNVKMSSGSRAGNHFRRILASGWHRAMPTAGVTFFGHRGKTSEIDHVLATGHCLLSDAACVQEVGGFVFSGSSSAISDHAALVCRVELHQ